MRFCNKKEYSRMTDFPQTKLSNIGKDSTVNSISKAKKNKKITPNLTFTQKQKKNESKYGKITVKWVKL